MGQRGNLESVGRGSNSGSAASYVLGPEPVFPPLSNGDKKVWLTGMLRRLAAITKPPGTSPALHLAISTSFLWP